MSLNIKGNVLSSNDVTSVGVFKSKINRDGLICYLDAASLDSYSGAGTTWTDLTGTGNNFILSSSPTYTSGSKFTFNGNSSQFAYCVNLVPTDYVTVEIGFKKNSELVTEDIIFNKENTWEMHTNGDNLEWAVMSTNVSWFWYTVQAISIGTNYIVSLVYDGNTVRTYVNGLLAQTYLGYTGVLGNQSSAYPKINSRGDVQTAFGGGGDNDVYFFRIYNRVLSPFEIAENFQANRGRLGI